MASSSVATATQPPPSSSSRKLEDQAATAALLAHKANIQNVLDNENRLSSAGKTTATLLSSQGAPLIYVIKALLHH